MPRAHGWTCTAGDMNVAAASKASKIDVNYYSEEVKKTEQARKEDVCALLPRPTPIHPCRVYHRTITPPPLTTAASIAAGVNSFSFDPIQFISIVFIAIDRNPHARTHGTDAGRHCCRCLQSSINPHAGGAAGRGGAGARHHHTTASAREKERQIARCFRLFVRARGRGIKLACVLCSV